LARPCLTVEPKTARASTICPPRRPPRGTSAPANKHTCTRRQLYPCTNPALQPGENRKLSGLRKPCQRVFSGESRTPTARPTATGLVSHIWPPNEKRQRYSRPLRKPHFGRPTADNLTQRQSKTREYGGAMAASPRLRGCLSSSVRQQRPWGSARQEAWASPPSQGAAASRACRNTRRKHGLRSPRLAGRRTRTDGRTQPVLRPPARVHNRVALHHRKKPWNVAAWLPPASPDARPFADAPQRQTTAI